MAEQVKRDPGKTQRVLCSLSMFITATSEVDDAWRARVRGLVFEGTWEQCWDWINKRLAEHRKDPRTQRDLRGG